MPAPINATINLTFDLIKHPIKAPKTNPTPKRIHKLVSVVINEGNKFKNIILIIKQNTNPETKIAVSHTTLCQ
jgi:hypothetical protein